MDSVTRGSGIALSTLIAATASIVLLLPGKPAGPRRGPGPPGRVVMASAVATLTWTPALDLDRDPPPAAGPAARRLAGPRPGCRAAGALSGRAGAGVPAGPTTVGPGGARRGRPGQDHAVGLERAATRTRSGGKPDTRNPPGSALMSSDVMRCWTARSWPPSSQATEPGSPRPMIATRGLYADRQSC